MTMKTYWDYTEKERSEMTEEQVKGFLDCELMSKGILKPAPIVLETVEQIDLPTVTCYRLKHDWREIGPLFAKHEDALAASRMELLIDDSDYQTVKSFVAPMTGVSVIEVALPPMSCKATAFAALSAAKQRKKRNDNAQAEFDKATKEAEKATSEVWDDWYSCHSMASGHRKIIDTMAEYTKLTGGDENLASTFLAKAFSEDRIREAFEWFGMEDPRDLGQQAPQQAPANVEPAPSAIPEMPF
jgi:ribosomal protein L12E/L44/L45/RPP1/RPP2